MVGRAYGWYAAATARREIAMMQVRPILVGLLVVPCDDVITTSDKSRSSGVCSQHSKTPKIAPVVQGWCTGVSELPPESLCP